MTTGDGTRSVRRLEDFRFLTGSGRYVEDALDGEAYAYVPPLAARPCRNRADRDRDGV